MKNYGFGVDVGGTTIKIGFFEKTGNLIEKWEIPTDTTDSGKCILNDIAVSIKSYIKKNQIEESDVIGIGVGVPGPVTNGSKVSRCVNLGWTDVNVVSELSALTGLHVKVANDANIAALGEMWQGGAKGSRNVVVITLGTGVGGGIIVDGKVVEGFHGAGGEFGHLVVNRYEKEQCNCGNYGCLEQYVSATGVVRMTNKYLKENKKDTYLRRIDNLSAKDIFDAAKLGDEAALNIVSEFGYILGSTLAKIATVVDPEVFVFGGGVSKAGSIIVDNVKKAYISEVLFACKDARFALATLGNDAGIYGGMRLVLNED